MTCLSSSLASTAFSSTYRSASSVRLVTVWADADDEAAVAPILARYARERVKIDTIIATDGAQGAANTSVPRGPELAIAS